MYLVWLFLFYNTLAQAQTDDSSNPTLNIDLPFHTNDDPYDDSIVIKLSVIGSNETCDTYVDLNLKVVNSPIFVTDDPYHLTLCDYDANGTDGITAFDLTSYVDELLAPEYAENGTTASDYTVAFYLNYDANTDTLSNQIANDTAYENISNGQIIYIAVSAATGEAAPSDTVCTSVKALTLQVEAPPVTDFKSIKLCDDDAPGVNSNPHPMLEFDLTWFETETEYQISSETGNSYTYFENLSDAQNNTNAITNPSTYIKYNTKPSRYLGTSRECSRLCNQSVGRD